MDWGDPAVVFDNPIGVMMLYSVTEIPVGRTVWCGPSALSIITGVGYARTLDLLKEAKARRHPWLDRVTVKGTTNQDMRIVLDRLGYDLVALPVDETATFARWLRERSAEVRGEVVLVVAGHHYMVVWGNRACDGIVREPRFISRMPGRRKRMANAWIVRPRDKAVRREAIRETETVGEHRAAQRSGAIRQYGLLYREAQALARKLGLVIETSRADGGRLTIYPPDGFLLEDLSGYGFSGSNRWEDALSYLQHVEQRGITECLTPDEEYEPT